MATVLNDVLPCDQLLDGDARVQIAKRALRSALLLGVAGDLLLRGGGLGVNALLYTLLVAGNVWALDLERGDGATRERLPLLAPVVAAGLALAWRDGALLSLGAVMWFVLAIALHAAALRAGPAWNLWQLDPAAPIRAYIRTRAGLEAPAGGAFGDEWVEWSPYTYPFNLTQQPAASVPCGFTSEGLPIGLQIVGAPRADALVLRAARAFESARPWPTLSSPRTR